MSSTVVPVQYKVTLDFPNSKKAVSLFVSSTPLTVNTTPTFRVVSVLPSSPPDGDAVLYQGRPYFAYNLQWVPLSAVPEYS